MIGACSTASFGSCVQAHHGAILPVCYGPRTTCYNRFVRWRRAEIWGRKQLIAEMEEEERRAAREGLTEEELAIFDLLTKPEPRLTKTQEIEVKKVARELN